MIEEEETLFNNITQVRHIHTISIIVHFVILSGNSMAVRRLPAIPSCKLYISEKIMTSGACILKQNHILNKKNCINNNMYYIYNISAL